MDGDFDYVIVGAGSAGCVLANRLTADGRFRVLLIEAGGSDLRPWVQVPIGYGMAFHDGRINWKYTTEPVPGLGGRTSYWPRGKVLGGSSSINAMVYVRGHRQDFDDWAAAGADGWGWDGVAPYFQRMEAWAGGDDPARGRDGPLAIEPIEGRAHGLCDTWLDGTAEAGIAETPDYNGAQMDGAFRYQLTTRGGFRASTARCYLRPARRRANLAVVTGAQVMRLGTERQVTYRRAGRTHEVRARRDVILSAGAVNSPQLLMLSGLGPGAALQAHGIVPKRDLPAVGQHMQDHLGVDIHYRSRVRTLNEELRPWLGRIKAAMRYAVDRRGPLSLSVNQGGGFVRLDEGEGAPNQQLYFSPVSYTRACAGKRALMSPDPFPGFLIGFSACRPTSRGAVTLSSADPMAPPAIQPNYLATNRDRAEALQGMRLLRRIAETTAFQQVIESEISPGPEAVSDEALLAHIRDTAWTVFHPCGTCRMGTDPATSVVDPHLRVHGIPGLRVVDASVFPNVTSGNINAPVIMVAERAADLILEDAQR
ncbi:MAG: GMC oxidoreductase [Pseudomonadota bacterium]